MKQSYRQVIQQKTTNQQNSTGQQKTTGSQKIIEHHNSATKSLAAEKKQNITEDKKQKPYNQNSYENHGQSYNKHKSYNQHNTQGHHHNQHRNNQGQHHNTQGQHHNTQGYQGHQGQQHNQNHYTLTYKPTGPDRSFELCKIMPENKKSFGFKFTIGLNEDTREFTSELCSAGGLHYCYEQDIAQYSWIGPLIATVKVPADASVVEFDDKAKANKLIIESIIPIRQYIQERYPVINGKYHPQILNWLREEPKFIQYIPEQSESLCLFALDRNCYAIHGIKKRTEQMYDFAISHDAHLIRLPLSDVSLSPELKQKYQKMAIVQFGYHLKQFKQKKWLDTSLVTSQQDVMEYLYKHHRDTIKYIPQDLTACLTAVKFNGLALKYVKEQTMEICTTAMTQNPACYKYVKKAFLIGSVKKMKQQYKKSLQLNKTSLVSSCSGVSVTSTQSTQSTQSTPSSRSSRSSRSSISSVSSMADSSPSPSPTLGLTINSIDE